MSAITAREALDAMFVPGSDADADEFARRVEAVVAEALGADTPCAQSTPPDLADRIYNALTAYENTTPNHLRRDTAWRLHLADHLAGVLTQTGDDTSGYATTRGEPGQVGQ